MTVELGQTYQSTITPLFIAKVIGRCSDGDWVLEYNGTSIFRITDVQLKEAWKLVI